jgi:hypothetical protein
VHCIPLACWLGAWRFRRRAAISLGHGQACLQRRAGEADARPHAVCRGAGQARSLGSRPPGGRSADLFESGRDRGHGGERARSSPAARSVAVHEPLAAVPRELRRRAVRVRPELVAEVEFRGWTAGRLLRHSSFRNLVDD